MLKPYSCANGDLIQACVQLIRRRLAPVIFVWVKGHSGNANNDTADHLAAEGRLLCLPATSPLPQVLDNHQGKIVLPSGPVLSRLKVYTDLPAKTLAHAAHVQEENAEYDGAEVSEDDDEILPYTSQETRTLGMHFLTEVTQARTPAMFWKSIRSLTGGQPRPPQVTAAELHDVFRERMNRQDVLVRDPLAAMRNLDGLFMESVRRPTSDNTGEMFFSRPVTEDEIAAVKAKLKEHNMNSAKGADGLAYAELLQVPNEDLQELFQQCIDSCDAPQTWLTTILAAVEKKPGKARTDANSYRNIGLESCLLKMLTLIIDRRLRDWAAATGRVPMMQNGFRAGHRTMNNVFTLRAVVESTRARAETLWVVLVDLKNAFPSVDQNVLWKKLMDWGVSGPLLDWLRMLYDRMQYVVRYAGELSQSFRSFAGILIGDPASPILWNLFFADFDPPPHPDDVYIDGVRIPYMAQADDILFMALSKAGILSKVHALQRWCMRNGVEINLLKTVLLVFGRLPPDVSLPLMGGNIGLVPAATYVGARFSTTTRHIFAEHREAKAKAARCVANVTLSLESYVGSIPPRVARTIYLAHVDPHLTYGCEVDLDVDDSSYIQLENVQVSFLRRSLLLSRHSPRVILYTMMNIWPLRYRRALLALRYLEYVLSARPSLPYAALRSGFDLVQHARPSWWSDLCYVLRSLPSPVDINSRVFPTTQAVGKLVAALSDSLANYLISFVRSSPRMYVYNAIHGQHLPPRPTLSQLCGLPHYMALNRDRRRALIKLVASEHPYAVQTLRHTRPPVPRNWRVCRFCRRKDAVETEEHIIFGCSSPLLLQATNHLLEQLQQKHPNIHSLRRTLTTSWSLVEYLMRKPDLLALFADHVVWTYVQCKHTPPLRIGSQAEYDNLSSS